MFDRAVIKFLSSSKFGENFMASQFYNFIKREFDSWIFEIVNFSAKSDTGEKSSLFMTNAPALLILRYKNLYKIWLHSHGSLKLGNSGIIEHFILVAFIFNFDISDKIIEFTLTRPIGLPPHTPVAQKIADQPWLIADSTKDRYFFI